MYSVYQHWDPLKVALVGITYPPEFFNFIKDVGTRKKFERMALETEEDYQNLINKLGSFGVEVLRPQLPKDLNELYVDGKWVAPPTAPRDYFIMIGQEFWVPTVPNGSHAWHVFYRDIQQHDWPWFDRERDFKDTMPKSTVEPVMAAFIKFQQRDQSHLDSKLKFYHHVFEKLRSQGNTIRKTNLDFINGCFVSRIGQDLYFATQTYHDDQELIRGQVNELFPHTRNHVVNAGGHGDATYCPVTPGLIISLRDIPTYADSFPDWEVVYLPASDYSHMRKFEASMKHNKGRWFVPGFDSEPKFKHMVDHYFDQWVGQVSETVFDVNILVVDHHNIIVSAPNLQVEQACARYGVNVHVVPFRHKYFWDCGIHCVTNDINRLGTKLNVFAS